jgi:hypothetical protein
MLSPVVGPAVRQLLGTEQAPFALETFTLSRFEHRSPSFALQSTSDL